MKRAESPCAISGTSADEKILVIARVPAAVSTIAGSGIVTYVAMMGVRRTTASSGM
jgi:hypothetical protein